MLLEQRQEITWSRFSARAANRATASFPPQPPIPPPLHETKWLQGKGSTAPYTSVTSENIGDVLPQNIVLCEPPKKTGNMSQKQAFKISFFVKSEKDQ